MDEFLKIAAPMTTLTRKNVQFEWLDACEQSFQELKKRLVTMPILTIAKEKMVLLSIVIRQVKG